MSSLFSFRTLIAVVFGIVFIILFCYYNESVDTVMSLEREKEKCQQNLDTISAQLQVVYEHKSRLEKSLQQEKENLFKHKTDQSNALTELRQKLENYKKKLGSLQSEYDNLQLKYNEVKREKDEVITKAEHESQLNQGNSVVIKEKFAKMENELEKLRTENGYLRSLQKSNFSQPNHFDLIRPEKFSDAGNLPAYPDTNQIAAPAFNRSNNNSPREKFEPVADLTHRNDSSLDGVIERLGPNVAPPRPQNNYVGALPPPAAADSFDDDIGGMEKDKDAEIDRKGEREPDKNEDDAFDGEAKK